MTVQQQQAEESLWWGITEAYGLFTHSARALVSDRAAQLDWDLFLRVALAYYASSDSNQLEMRAPQQVTGEWVESTARPWVSYDGILPTRTLHRLGQSFMEWQERRPESIGWEDLDQGLTAAIEERSIKVEAVMLSPVTARLVAKLLSPIPAEPLFSFGSAGGEVIGPYVSDLMERSELGSLVVHVTDRRASLHALTRFRVLLATQRPETVDRVQTYEYLASTHGMMASRIYAALLDEQMEEEEARKQQQQISQIAGLLDRLQMDGRMVLAVPEVVLNGATWEHVRKDWLESGHLRLVVQLPREAIKNGAIKCGLLVFEKTSHWPPQVGVIMANLQAKGKDVDVDQALEVLGAIKGEAPKSSFVWYQEKLEGARLDPAFYRNRDIVEQTLRKLRYPVMRLRELGVQVRQNQTTTGYLGNLRDRTVTAPSINGLRIDEDLCRVGPMRYSYPLTTGAVLLTAQGTIGKAVVVPSKFEGWRLGSGVIELLIPPKVLDPYYLAVLLESELGQAMLRIATKGSQSEFLPLHEVRDLQIPVPPLEQQRRIATEAVKLYGQANERRQEAQTLEEQARQRAFPLVTQFTVQQRHSSRRPSR